MRLPLTPAALPNTVISGLGLTLIDLELATPLTGWLADPSLMFVIRVGIRVVLLFGVLDFSI
jgi:hypothetical protein